MGPKPTGLLARTTPPPSTGWPVRSTLMAPTAPPLSVASIRRVTCPFALGFDRVSDPVSDALNGAAGTDAVVVGAGVLVAAGVVPTFARTLAGVPAWRAQPAARGPVVSQATRTSGATKVVTNAPTRTPVCSRQPTARRHQIAKITATMHTTVRMSTKPTFVSLPVARPWTTTRGQQRYENQCTHRQVRCPIRCRKRLVARMATSRSNATAPIPNHTGRYGERNGITASTH